MGWFYLAVWTKITIAEDNIIAKTAETEERLVPREDEERFENYFLYTPMENSSLQGDVAHAGGFCFDRQVRERKPI